MQQQINTWNSQWNSPDIHYDCYQQCGLADGVGCIMSLRISEKHGSAGLFRRPYGPRGQIEKLLTLSTSRLACRNDFQTSNCFWIPEYTPLLLYLALISLRRVRLTGINYN